MDLSCRFWPHLNYLNYGDFIFDRKGILSSVYLDEETLHGWKKLTILFHKMNEFPTPNPITQFAFSTFSRMSTSEDQEYPQAPAIKDTFISFDKWGKGIAFVNEFNLGRYWPSKGPQRNLYVPAPLLKEGDNTLVELDFHVYFFSKLFAGGGIKVQRIQLCYDCNKILTSTTGFKFMALGVMIVMLDCLFRD
ncbi:hypothetical protein K1719_000637 [Acacia pycnantha]|nr:hypothetical protein K1719_000637 [Acacia pycnantha]